MRFRRIRAGRSAYSSQQEARADRAALLEFLNVLHATRRALRRDGCQQWHILGERGHIYTEGTPGSWTVVVLLETARQWSAIRTALHFCRLIQNGDSEGNFRLDGLPTPEQAVAIRKVLGIRKRRAFDPRTYERLRRDGQSRLSRERTGDDRPPLPE